MVEFPERLAFVGFVFVACGLPLGCKTKTPDAAVDAGAALAIEAGALKSVAGPAGSGVDEDEVRPVYPVDGVTPDPLAARLCTALHELPEKRRSACCGQSAGLVPTSECVRMLSAALHGKAVELGAGDVDACALAIDRAYAGCDWVGPFPPEVPAACLGIVHGKLARNDRCRSSLECAGDLRCHGVGPTTVGRCGPARDDGGACAGSSDALASFVRQNDVDARHPECKGYCSRFKCSAFAAEGALCAQSRECGPGRQCLGAGKGTGLGAKSGKCVTRAPGKAGEPCPGATCEAGLLCLSGRCAARKPAGASCETDFECAGGCLESDAGRRTCGRKCGVR
jgi:hypothetical protein